MYSPKHLLKVPSWAEAMVSNYRRELSIPDTISDELIFTFLENETRGMNQVDILETLKQELLEE